MTVNAVAGTARDTRPETLAGKFPLLTVAGAVVAVKRRAAGGWAISTYRYRWPVTTAAAAVPTVGGAPRSNTAGPQSGWTN